MTFGARFTWEKLILETKLLHDEDFGTLIPLCIGINSVLWPQDNFEICFRQMQFLNFEVLKTCEGLGEAERWEALRQLVFSIKGFQFSSARLQESNEEFLLIKPVLEKRRGHPLTIAFVLLHLTYYLDLPLTLVQARHHFLFKWVRSGKNHYLDLFNEGRSLTDNEVIHVLNRAEATLEVWTARQLLREYLELLAHSFESTQTLPALHIIYNLILVIDDANTSVLGRRALLRQKLGFHRDAMSDLKRYFSFVEKNRAPVEIRQAWLELEAAPEPAPRGPSDLLH